MQVIGAAPYYTTAVMAVDVHGLSKGQCVRVKYTRTVKNIDGKDEDLFHVWVGSGSKYPSELFYRALTRCTI